MNNSSDAAVNAAATSEEELRIAFTENPISDEDLEFLFNDAFVPDLPGTANTQVQRPTIESSTAFSAFLASEIDPTTSVNDEEAAPPTMQSTLLLRNGEGS